MKMGLQIRSRVASFYRTDHSATFFASDAVNVARLLPLLHSEWRRGLGRGGASLLTPIDE